MPKKAAPAINVDAWKVATALIAGADFLCNEMHYIYNQNNIYNNNVFNQNNIYNNIYYPNNIYNNNIFNQNNIYNNNIYNHEID